MATPTLTTPTLDGKPYAGNPHVRFDEGKVASEKPRRGSLLYTKLGQFAAAWVAVVCACGAGMAYAADYYVATTGAAENPGTAEAPFATIAVAIEAAQEGDTIHVAPGDYNEWGLKIEKVLRIEGDAGAVVYGFETPYSGTGRRIFYMTADATIANLTIRNGGFRTDGKPANGGNVFMSAGTVTNCVIEGGYVEHTADAGGLKGALGGNVFMTGGLVVDCEIKDGGIYNSNGAGGGGNVMMYNGGRLMRCKVTGARRTAGTAARYTEESGGSGLYMNGAAIAENCLITGNSGSYGAVSMRGASKLVNCTIAGNSGGYNGYNGVCLCDASPMVINCVIWNDGTAKECLSSSAGFYNCAAPITIEKGVDCRKVLGSNEDNFADDAYRPKSTSEFVNIGSDSLYAQYAVSGVDFDGLGRFNGPIDPGCYECNESSIAASKTSALVGDKILFSAVVAGRTGSIEYEWDFGNGETRTTDSPTYEYAFPAYGQFSVTMTARAAGYPDETIAFQTPFTIVPRTLYVDAASQNPSSPYAGPESAANDLASAVETALDGCTIRVAPNDYRVCNLTIAKAIRIVGTGASRDDVVLKAADAPYGGSGRVLRIIENAWIENLTICNGAFWTVSGKDENGGNVFMSSGTITNCVITGGLMNHSADGTIKGALGGNVYMRGGLVVDCDITKGYISNVAGAGGGGNVVMFGGGARLMRCRVSDATRNGSPSQHTAESGGSGIYMNGDVTAENCLIVRNAGSCGAVSMIGDARLVNCTIADNSGNYEGRNGLYLRDGKPKVINTIVFGDDTAVGSWGGVYGGCLDHCAVSAEVAGGSSCVLLKGGLLSNFDDNIDYRPQTTLGLDKAGSDELYDTYAISPTDIEGKPRKIDGIGVGCHEIEASGFSCSGAVNKPSALRGEALTFTAMHVGADRVTYRWNFGNGEVVETDQPSLSYAFPTSGVFTVVLTAEAAGTQESANFTLVPIPIIPEAIYVNAANETPESPYDRPERAARSIKTALLAIKDDLGKVIADGVVVHVASGVYTESGIKVDRVTRIVGEGAQRTNVVFQASATPLQNAGQVFQLTGGASIYNMTVRNGCQSSTSFNGGNVYVQDGIVSNCVIVGGHMSLTYGSGSEAAQGGNLYLKNAIAVDCDILDGSMDNINGAGGGFNVAAFGGSRLVRCRIQGGYRTGDAMTDLTKASGGSGVYANGTGTVVENCLIANNSGSYGALMLRSGARAVHCTVVANADNFEGCNGLVVFDSSCSAVNCAMHNTATDAVGEWGNMNGVKFENCASPVEISGGINCVTLDKPLASIFKNTVNYAPSSTSPLRNAGSSYLGDDKAAYGIDLLGNRRFIGKAIDIGCCEALPERLLIIVR